jgi:hypothetical protein
VHDDEQKEEQAGTVGERLEPSTRSAVELSLVIVIAGSVSTELVNGDAGYCTALKK